MTLFLMTPEVAAHLAELRKEAEKHPIDHDAMLAWAEAEAAGRPFPLSKELVPRQTALPFGWTVAYSLEEHKPGVMCRHLSVASPAAGRVPAQQTVEMLLPCFGWVGGLKNTYVLMQDLGGGRQAVNLVQPVSGDMHEMSVRLNS